MTQAATLRTESGVPDILNLTPSAQSKISELLTEAGDEVLGIRVFVAGGGCGGMGYGMTYADQVTGYDHVIEGSGYKVIIDAVALNFLSGAEIDFTADSHNPSFVFRNAYQAPRTGGGGCGAGGCGGGGCGR